jgi:hypothetical protein
MRAHVLLPLLSSAILLASRADAVDPAAEAAAEALFKQAKKLADAGSYAEACPKFEASQKKSPAAGTLVNLADCYEHLGKIASAWVTYREATRAAAARKRADWEALSRDRATLLEPKVAKLVVGPAPGPEPPELRITRDGDVVSRAEWGVPIPVDPGTHVVQATATSRTTFERTVEIGADGRTTEVLVQLVEASGGAPAPAPAPAPTPAPAHHATDRPASLASPPSSAAGLSTQKTIGIALGGAGVVAIGVGAVTGAMTLGRRSDLDRMCSAYPLGCTSPAEARGVNDDAQSLATVSTVAFVAGGVLLAAGAVLFFTAPKAQAWGLHVAPTVGATQAGGVVGARF